MLQCRGLCERGLMPFPFYTLFRLSFSALWRGSRGGRIPAVFAALLFLAPFLVAAQETEPPSPAPTVTPSPVSSLPADGEAGGDAMQEADSSDTTGVAAETIPTPAPAGEPKAASEASTAAKTEGGGEGSAKPVEGFDLHAYPETAKLPPKQKWQSFKEGLRGLLVWDFFDSRLTIRAQARIQVDGTAREPTPPSKRPPGSSERALISGGCSSSPKAPSPTACGTVFRSRSAGPPVSATSSSKAGTTASTSSATASASSGLGSFRSRSASNK